jgi:hypothetical protein
MEKIKPLSQFYQEMNTKVLNRTDINVIKGIKSIIDLKCSRSFWNRIKSSFINNTDDAISLNKLNNSIRLLNSITLEPNDVYINNAKLASDIRRIKTHLDDYCIHWNNLSNKNVNVNPTEKKINF